MKVDLKGVFKVRAKGRTYYYAWRGGPRLDGEPGSPEFIESYHAARSPLAGIDKRKFGAWVTLYRNSEEFRALAPSTRAMWQPWLDRVKAHFGNLSIRQFDRPQIRADIRKWRDKWRTAPRQADYAKQVLSRVISFAVADGALLSNVCAGIPNIYATNRADKIWEPADLEALEKAASKEIVWAAKLAAHTGLRREDLVTLSWTHVGALAIEMKTGKSRGRRSAIIPLTAPLKALLAEIPRLATTVLTNSRRRPWTKHGFSSSWHTAVKLAGLEPRGLHLHDLRGTAATNFYRAQLTLREIADILGWSEDRVERLIDRYVKRDELLRDRIRRMEGARP